MRVNKLIVLLIAAMLIALPSTLPGRAAEQDVPLEEAPDLDDVSAANAGAALLTKHESIAKTLSLTSYEGDQKSVSENMTALIKAGDAVDYYENINSAEVVYDGANRYLIFGDREMGVNICFDDSMENSYAEKINSYAVYSRVEGETLTACHANGDQYILTTSISGGDFSAAQGRDFGIDDSASVEITLSVDAHSLEVSEWSATAHTASGDELPLVSVKAAYDAASLPEKYYEMAQPAATRDITIITNPMDDSKVRTDVVTIAEGAKPYVIDPQGYVLMIMDADQQLVVPCSDDIPAFGDFTLYLIRSSCP